ncbi:hypothetical protein GCM10010400_34430 [Streptomyces aculeolatus]
MVVVTAVGSCRDGGVQPVPSIVAADPVVRISPRSRSGRDRGGTPAPGGSSWGMTRTLTNAWGEGPERGNKGSGISSEDFFDNSGLIQANISP